MRITPGDFESPEVRSLISDHLQEMRATSPACSVHALDLTKMRDPRLSFWTVWAHSDADERLAGCGALKDLDGEGEIKTMRTVPVMRGRGVARLMLEHIISQARARNFSRVSLETGSQDFFSPARSLYYAHGFTECPPFGDYTEDPNSVFMTLAL
ncbi:GNAT family N-acetyltransferase [Nesterenkonia salmonea]|uniref:GNAT family N-acetyltransferase n=1 Tax=Nesterenkonia salmonea TaxID=1804987 RepID=A0A5R9BB24_9MICC|nr:GNAT family N-acetyltransferase [Nesterenkonia salmonea]TLP97431.1 GNAT family N-acetyltransferase [Nesterenkonia salmonea]